MPKHMDVGRSANRTPAKHDLMSSLIGEEIGVVNRAEALRDRRRCVWIDLTAGDAKSGDGEKWHRSCSPGILAHHAAWGGSAAIEARKPVSIVLHEIQPNTYDRLLQNLGAQLPCLGYTRDGEDCWRIGDKVTVAAINASGQNADIDFVRQTDAVFVLNDPNAITEWAMRDTFAQEIAVRTWCFRSLSTMGCNAAGLKRLEKEQRLHWFAFPETQERALPRHRDLLLAAIERDKAQWAYLVSTSEKWRGKTESIVQTAFKRHGHTMGMAWLRRDAPQFEEMKRSLFLTKAERFEDMNPPLFSVGEAL